MNKHSGGVGQRHVGEGRHWAVASECDGKFRFHIGFIETRESSTSVDWFHLSRCQISSHERRRTRKRRIYQDQITDVQSWCISIFDTTFSWVKGKLIIQFNLVQIAITIIIICSNSNQLINLSIFRFRFYLDSIFHA